jgi:peptide/nickel transport system permease protein
MGMAIPGFWLGIMLILIFAVQLKWLPASGYVPLREDPSQNLKHLILPAITLAILLMAPIMRFLRSSMLEVMREDYVRTARAKGLSERTVIYGHVFKNALIPTVTVVGLQFAGLMGGAVIIEWVFAWPGIGWLAIQSIFQRDYTVVQSTVLLVTTAFVLINLIVDILYGVIDPRIRY